MNILQRILSPSWHPGRAAITGVVALGVYTMEMETDMAVTGNRFSDVRFIEGLLTRKTTPQKRFSVLAWLIHLLNGILLAELYAAIFKRFLPGPLMHLLFCCFWPRRMHIRVTSSVLHFGIFCFGFRA